MSRPKPPIDTPAKVTQAREYLSLDKAGLAAELRLGKSGRDTVRRWEAPGATVPGPAQVALEFMVKAHG